MYRIILHGLSTLILSRYREIVSKLVFITALLEPILQSNSRALNMVLTEVENLY
jgi:hypothetical protein